MHLSLVIAKANSRFILREIERVNDLLIDIAFFEDITVKRVKRILYLFIYFTYRLILSHKLQLKKIGYGTGQGCVDIFLDLYINNTMINNNKYIFCIQMK